MTRAVATTSGPAWQLHRLAVPGGTLGVAEYSGAIPGSGEALLLLHGFTGSHRSWDAVAPSFAPLGRCLAVDLPGHGESDLAPDASGYLMEMASAALAAALEALHVAHVTLIGYSMGGRLALHFALTRPERVRRLVLESAGPGLATEAARAERRRSDDALAQFVLDHGIEAFVDRWESVPVLRSEQRLPSHTRALLRQARLRCSPAGLAASLRGMGAGSQPWLGDRLHLAAMPVLLIVGEDDAKFVEIAQAMSRSLPDATVVVVPGAGHNVHLEREEAFVHAVHQFMDGVWAANSMKNGENRWQSLGKP